MSTSPLLSGPWGRAGKRLGPESLGALSPEARGRLRRLQAPRPWMTAALYLRTYGLVIAAAWGAVLARNPALSVLAICFIAARQHTLYILNHDASHGGLFRSKRANKLASTCLSVFPFLHHPEAWSYVNWRREHMLHHRHLFTPQDPNYVGRKNRGDTEAVLTRAFLLLRCCWTGVSSAGLWLRARHEIIPLRGAPAPGVRSHLRALLVPFQGDPELEAERRAKLVFMAALAALLTVVHGWGPFLLYWVVPMYTVFPALLHLMDMTEHRWTAPTGDLLVNTRTSRLGPLGKLFIADLPRTFHREHHLLPSVPVDRLPRFHRLLAEAELVPPASRLFEVLRQELPPWRRTVPLPP